MSAAATSKQGLLAALHLLRLIDGKWAAQAIAVAAELRLMDRIAVGPCTAEALASATRCHGPSLVRLLRALATLGLCEERRDGTFAQTALGALLGSDADDSLRTYAIRSGRYQWPAWGKLLESVQTGQCARAAIDGEPAFDHLSRNPALASIFHGAVTEMTRLIARAVLPVFDFSAFDCIADVGGGYGELLIAILKACPGTRGILFDRPGTLAGARQRFRAAGIANRCQFVAGDFFQSVPGGADAYLLKSILHDWDDARATAILRSCREAMSSDGTLLLVEQIMPERMEASALHADAARSDLNMLVMLGGRERTASEYRSLLELARFEMTGLVPAALNFAVIRAAPR